MQCTFRWQMCRTLRTHISTDDIQDTSQFQRKLFFLVVKIELGLHVCYTSTLPKSYVPSPREYNQDLSVKINNICNDCQKLLSHIFLTVEFWVSHYVKWNRLGSLAKFKDSKGSRKKNNNKRWASLHIFTSVQWRETFEEHIWSHSRSLNFG